VNYDDGQAFMVKAPKGKRCGRTAGATVCVVAATTTELNLDRRAKVSNVAAA